MKEPEAVTAPVEGWDATRAPEAKATNHRHRRAPGAVVEIPQAPLPEFIGGAEPYDSVRHACSGIYAILNAESGRFYIGSAIDIRKRRNQHICQLRRGIHANRHLQAAFRKYGEPKFRLVVVELTPDLEAREQHYLDLCAGLDLYNIFRQAYSVSGPEHPMFGRTHSHEAKEKIRDARRLQVVSHSPETRRKIGAGNRGRVPTPETIEKMRQSRRGRPTWNKGLTAQTNESLRAISLATRMVLDAGLVVARYQGGSSVNAIAKELRCGWDVVRRALLESGVSIRSISEQKRLRDRA